MFEVLTVLTGVALAQIAPGPNLLAVAGSSLGHGRKAGLATALGVAASVLYWATLFAFGVAALLTAMPQLVTALRFIGGAYLLYLGVKTILLSRGTTPPLKPSSDANTLRAAFFKGVLVNVTNPKTAMMWIAVSMYLGGSGVTSFGLLAVGCAMALSAAMIYSGYAFILSTGLAMRGYTRFFRFIETAFGLIFGAIGGKLILDGLQDLRP